MDAQTGANNGAYINKDETTLPTVTTEGVFLTAVIDAMEGRDVAVIDVPGAFMQAEMGNVVYMRLDGAMVDIMLLEIAHDAHDVYEPCVIQEGRTQAMYVILNKALYGTLKAARLFWDLLSGKLRAWAFEQNPYDKCVVNKDVNRNQLTVTWHVDDLKVSHMNAQVVTDFVKQMNEEFGKETPLNESRGKCHNYLGMILDFSEAGAVQIDMTEYVKTMIRDMPCRYAGICGNTSIKAPVNIKSKKYFVSIDKKIHKKF